MAYQPLYIAGNTTGLVQNRQQHILPNDAYPILLNAYLFREQVKRKLGTELLGRFRRTFSDLSLGNSGSSPWTFVIWSTLSPPITPEPNAEIEPGSVIITVGTDTFTDLGNGTLKRQDGNTQSTINYITGSVTLFLLVSSGTAATIDFNYYPSLPVMGLRDRETVTSSLPSLVAFDTVYAYIFTSGGYQEFIPGTTWTGSDSNFFWSTNYWTTTAGLKLFWVTNFSGTSGDPIRYTDGTSWTDFAPQVNATPTYLTQCLALLPFRGRLLAFNTYEGANLATSTNFPQRIRWSRIGDPIPSMDNPDPWRDDITGQGGFLNVPTSQNITAVGFVRDNLVVYCEGSTWQLRYTGRSIAPFQIEQVNPELGAESLFSAIQMDTSLIGIGDKGVVECNSFSSERIDVKIPELVFKFNNSNNGPSRVQGIRDYFNKLLYWTYPYVPDGGKPVIYPNRRLVYNYENDSWAIFTDSITALGSFYPPSGRTWLNANRSSPPSSPSWREAKFPWADRSQLTPDNIGGNQQGYTFYLDELTTNGVSLFIQNITGNTTTPTVITSPNHNLDTGQVITIQNIPVGTPFANSLNNPRIGIITGATVAANCVITSANHNLTTGNTIEIIGVTGMVELNGSLYVITVLNSNQFELNVSSLTFTPYVSGGEWIDEDLNVFGIMTIDANNFELYKYNPSTESFSTPQLDAPGTYIGGGEIAIRDNFTIQSKKFNFLEKGENIQMGFLDVLMTSTQNGAITLNVLLNYNESNPINVAPENGDLTTQQPDSFFNSVVPTTNADAPNIAGSKYMQRVYCPVRGNFITIVWTLSNGQMNGPEQESEVQIDAQILWIRPAGRLSNY